MPLELNPITLYLFIFLLVFPLSFLALEDARLRHIMRYPYTYCLCICQRSYCILELCSMIFLVLIAIAANYLVRRPAIHHLYDGGINSEVPVLQVLKRFPIFFTNFSLLDQPHSGQTPLLFKEGSFNQTFFSKLILFYKETGEHPRMKSTQNLFYFETFIYSLFKNEIFFKRKVDVTFRNGNFRRRSQSVDLNF